MNFSFYEKNVNMFKSALLMLKFHVCNNDHELLVNVSPRDNLLSALPFNTFNEEKRQDVIKM